MNPYLSLLGVKYQYTKLSDKFTLNFVDGKSFNPALHITIAYISKTKF